MRHTVKKTHTAACTKRCREEEGFLSTSDLDAPLQYLTETAWTKKTKKKGPDTWKTRLKKKKKAFESSRPFQIVFCDEAALGAAE